MANLSDYYGVRSKPQVFNSPGTWTRPNPAINGIWVTGTGGGASGAPAANTAGRGGASGTGITRYFVPVSGPVPVTIGAGGVGPPSGPDDYGADGGNSVVGSLTIPGGRTNSVNGEGPPQIINSDHWTPQQTGSMNHGGETATFPSPATQSYGAQSGWGYIGGSPATPGFQYGSGGAAGMFGDGATGGAANSVGGSAAANTGAGGGGGGQHTSPPYAPVYIGGSGGSGKIIIEWWE
jgi:hypothetical protein